MEGGAWSCSQSTLCRNKKASVNTTGLTTGAPWVLFCFFKIFFMWTIFKVFIEFVTILLLFHVLVFWPLGMWALSSPNRDGTSPPALGGKVLTTGPPGKSTPWGFEQPDPCNLNSCPVDIAPLIREFPWGSSPPLLSPIPRLVSLFIFRHSPTHSYAQRFYIGLNWVHRCVFPHLKIMISHKNLDISVS